MWSLIHTNRVKRVICDDFECEDKMRQERH
nr:MAG TPA: hypothetical protein [Caudoviricetes sp.]